MAKFEAKGKEIWKAAEWHNRPDGKVNMSIGFPIATVHEFVTNGEQVAKAIADVLTASGLGDAPKTPDPPPEPDETPKQRIGW